MEHTVDILRVCGIALVCTVLTLVLGRMQGGMAVAVRIGGGVLIFGILLSLLYDNIQALDSVLSVGNGELQGVFALMLKAVGVALVSRFCADICRDCGENTLAGGIEGVGRIVMIGLCLPVLGDILENAMSILDMGT